MSCLTEVTGVVLAGGRGSRMGGQDKGLILLDGLPLYKHVLRRLSPQVHEIAICANRNLKEYQSAGIRVLSDTLPDFPGPLAGMLSAMQNLESEWFLFCPCDTPNIPTNLATRLWHEHGHSPAVWVNDGERDHPTIVLLRAELVSPLEDYLRSGERRVMSFFRDVGGHAVVMKDSASNFTNVNTPEDLAQWKKM